MDCKFKTELGLVTVNDEVLVRVAGYAALDCYGIVGMASKRSTDGIVQLMGRENLGRAFLRPSAVRPGRRGGQWNQHLYWWNVFTKSVHSAMGDGFFTVDTIYIAIWYHRYNRHERIVIFYATCGFIKFFSLSITVCLKKT